MTWEELQLSALQKIFEIENHVLVVDESTAPYLAAMPEAANEAMLLLCTQAKYFRRSGSIVQSAEEGTTPSFVVGRQNAYELKQLFPDFYTLSDGSVMYTNGRDYLPASYHLEGESTLLLPAEQEGTWRISYCAYPQRLTNITPKDTEIALDPEAASLLALYIAGQVYKEDDISLAQTYMNEFLEWLDRLKAKTEQDRAERKRQTAASAVWYSKTGW